MKDAPGDWNCSEPDEVQPGGTEVDLAVEEGVLPPPTQGQTLGVTKLEVSRCVPLHGTGS